MYFLSEICAISVKFEVRFQLFPNCGLIKFIIHSASVVVAELITTVTETYVYFLYILYIFFIFIVLVILHILMMVRTFVGIKM